MPPIRDMLPMLTQLLRPPVDTARTYSVKKLRGDVMAGLTMAVVDVPQAMAYALIAGVPPQYGLYTSIVQNIVASLFASNPHLASGPTNTQSLLIAATVSRIADPGNTQMFIQLAIGLTLVKALIQLLFAAARMGALVRYVSQSVIVGFTAGAGVLIGAGQLAAFLGIDTGDAVRPLPGVPGVAMQLAPLIDQVNWHALVLGGVALGIIIMGRWMWRHFPGPLLAVIATAVLVYLMGWHDGLVQQIGALPAPGVELFSPAVPVLTLEHAEAMLAGAIALAILGMIETVAIGKTVTTGEHVRIDANQEFFSQGLANFVGAFFYNIPGSGSFVRSTLNVTTGGRTRFAALFNAGFVLLIFIALRGQARYIPLAALAAVLFVVAWRLIDWRYMLRITRTSKSEAAVCFITFVCTVTLPLQYAIYLGIFLNIALYLRQASRLHIAEMVQTEAGPYIERPLRERGGRRRVMFLQVEGDLFFGVADELRDRLRSLDGSGARVIIFRLKRTHSIDSTVMGVLEEFTRNVQARDGHVILCGIRPDLLDTMRRFGLVSVIGEANVFETGYGVFTSAKRAIQRARQLIGGTIDTEGLDLDDEHHDSWAYQI